MGEFCEELQNTISEVRKNLQRITKHYNEVMGEFCEELQKSICEVMGELVTNYKTLLVK